MEKLAVDSGLAIWISFLDYLDSPYCLHTPVNNTPSQLLSYAPRIKTR